MNSSHENSPHDNNPTWWTSLHKDFAIHHMITLQYDNQSYLQIIEILPQNSPYSPWQILKSFWHFTHLKLHIKIEDETIGNRESGNYIIVTSSFVANLHTQLSLSSANCNSYHSKPPPRFRRLLRVSATICQNNFSFSNLFLMNRLIPYHLNLRLSNQGGGNVDHHI